MLHTPPPEEIARMAFDLSPSGMLAVNSAGHVVALNQEIERLFGWPRHELLGQSIEVLVPPRYHGVHEGHRSGYLGEAHARPMGAGRELFGLRRDGTEFPVEIGLKPVFAGKDLFVLASVVDITARRSLEENQRRSQKLEAIGVLAGGIAHDFNNILLGIVGHTELVMRDPSLGRDGRDDLERVLAGAERGRDLVKRILLFSRETEVARVPLRLDRTMSAALELMRASLPSTVEIRTEFDPATPVVLSDETQIHQILMNLATNALHAMPEGGTLTISVAPWRPTPEYAAAHPPLQPGLHARVTVSDTGAGMPREVLDRVLEPFFTTKAPGQGTGLGLSVIHGIVRSHQGALEIQSAPNEGTRVIVMLPAAEGAADAAGEAAPARRGPHVMLVEDEAVLNRMQKRQLEHLGYEVTAHTSSLAALEDFRARPDAFALVITDDTMPQLRGTALAREVHRLRPELPILMVSGGDTTDREIQEAGVRRVLRKPHTLNELEKAIREVLAT